MLKLRVFSFLVLAFLIVRVANAGAVKLAWDPNPEGSVGGYRIYRGTVSGGPYTLIGSSSAPATFFTDDTAEGGRTHYYVVTAVSMSGQESKYSTEVSVITSRYDPGLQAGTVIVRATAPSSVQSGQVVSLGGMAWTPSGSPVSFSWKQLSGATVPIIGVAKSEASIVAPAVSRDTVLSFILYVTDGAGSISSDRVQFTVRPR